MKASIFLITKITLLSVLAFLLFVAGCQQQSKQAITEEEAQALNESVLKIWNEGQYDLVAELYTTDIVRHDCGWPEDIVGLENLKDYFTFNRTAFPDFQLTINKTIVKGDDIVWMWTIAGTNTGPMGDIPPTGLRTQISGISAGRFVDGKLAEIWDYYNQGAMLQQLGFTLTPPQPPEEESQ